MDGKTNQNLSEESDQRRELEDEADANVEPAGFFDLVSSCHDK